MHPYLPTSSLLFPVSPGLFFLLVLLDLKKFFPKITSKVENVICPIKGLTQIFTLSQPDGKITPNYHL